MERIATSRDPKLLVLDFADGPCARRIALFRVFVGGMRWRRKQRFARRLPASRRLEVIGIVDRLQTFRETGQVLRVAPGREHVVGRTRGCFIVGELSSVPPPGVRVGLLHHEGAHARLFALPVTASLGVSRSQAEHERARFLVDRLRDALPTRDAEGELVFLEKNVGERIGAAREPRIEELGEEVAPSTSRLRVVRPARFFRRLRGAEGQLAFSKSRVERFDAFERVGQLPERAWSTGRAERNFHPTNAPAPRTAAPPTIASVQPARRRVVLFAVNRVSSSRWA